jgi:hypothetical protein
VSCDLFARPSKYIAVDDFEEVFPYHTVPRGGLGGGKSQKFLGREETYGEGYFFPVSKRFWRFSPPSPPELAPKEP